MLFTALGRRLARQFTLTVFLLLLAVGMLYLALSHLTLRNESNQRLSEQVSSLEDQIRLPLPAPTNLLLDQRQRLLTRIADAKGNPILTGSLFSEISVPFEPSHDDIFYQVGGPSSTYRVISRTLYTGNIVRGYIQVAEPEDYSSLVIAKEAGLYLLVCLLISILTYVLGVRFAQQTLKPAQESMERLEQFTQDASHELRTPLAVISSSLDLALRTKDYKGGLLSAKEDVLRASSLVERLLDLARLDRLVIGNDRVDATNLVSDIVGHYEPVAKKKNISLKASTKDPVILMGDAALIRQLITNLLDNALKFTVPGGSISITLDSSQLAIEDTGEGIAAGKLASIFERFYQADDSRSDEGFGLGLAIVKRIADLHGWHISVSSQLKKGSRFVVDFPSRA